MKDVGRRCQRCGYGWYGQPPKGNPGKPRWFDETGAIWTDGQARMARRSANYDRHVRVKDAWEQCPNCGSRAVKSDKSKAFRPTGAITQAPTSPPPPAAPSQPAHASPSSAQPGSVEPSIWQRLGRFHGKHWRIIWFVVFAMAPFGSFGEDGIHTGNAALTVLAVVGTFIGFWALAVVFLRLHLAHVNAPRSVRSSNE